MMQTTAVVIGAGHAGLAMSHRLTERSIDHVVLERGEVANSWRTQRWPSLRLLTPNWLTRLPGYDYAGNDPDGYLPAAGVVATLTRYARFAAAPVCTATTVHTVRTTPGGFEIQANDDILHARAVVVATGACARPAIPAITGAVPRPITTLTPLTTRWTPRTAGRALPSRGSKGRASRLSQAAGQPRSRVWPMKSTSYE
jgi:putative flavoprotein involved in K+ transport